MLRKKNPTVKAIIMTDSEQYRAQSSSQNIDGYLLKPLDSDSVKAIISRVSK